MIATDQPDPGRSGYTRFRSPGLSVLLGLVVFSSVFSAIATFEAHEDFIVFDILFKAVHVSTLFFEAAFIVGVLIACGRMAYRGVVLDRPSGAELLLFALLLGYVVAVTMAHRETVPLFEPFWWILHIVFFGALRMAWAFRLTVNFQLVWTALVLASVAHMAIFAAFVFSLPDPETFDWPGKIPGFTNIRHLADFMPPAAALVGAVALAGPKKLVLPALAAFLVILLYPSWTGGRGSFLAVLAGLTVILLFNQARRPARIAALAGTVVVALALPLLLPQTGPWPAILERAGAVEIAQTTANKFSSDRLELWTQTIRAIGEAPVFGHGPVYISKVVPEGRIEHHPHNIGLQILFQWGLAGLAITLAVIGVHARRIARAIATGSFETIVAAAALAAILAHAQIDGPMYFPFSLVLALIAFFHLWAIGAAAEERPETGAGTPAQG